MTSDTSDRFRRALSEAIAGAGGIILSAYFVYPLDFVKTRLQLPQSTYTSMTDGFVRIVKEEGFLTLYQGVEGELLKGSLQNFIYLFSYDLLKGYAREEKMLVEEVVGRRGGGAGKVTHVRPLLNKTLHCYCFPEVDTRILTNHGFLFLDQIEWLLAHGQPVLYACYEVSKTVETEDGDEQLVESKELRYSEGELVIPKQPPPYLLEFASSGEDQRWTKRSCQYGLETEDTSAEVSASLPSKNQNRSRHVSLRVTPDHKMFVQQGVNVDGYTMVNYPKQHGVHIPPQRVDASTLECCCGDDEKASCEHRLAHIRMVALAEAGYSPQSTTGRRAVQSALHLSDAQFTAFIELFGFWLGDGSMIYRVDGDGSNAVQFSQVKGEDRSWLRSMFKKVGLRDDQWWAGEDDSDGDNADLDSDVSDLDSDSESDSDSDSKSTVQWSLHIHASAWFTYFDQEFGVKYRHSLHYRRPTPTTTTATVATSATVTTSTSTPSANSESPSSPTRSQRSISVDLSSNSTSSFYFTPRDRSISASSTESFTDAIASAVAAAPEPCCLLCGSGPRLCGDKLSVAHLCGDKLSGVWHCADCIAMMNDSIDNAADADEWTDEDEREEAVAMAVSKVESDEPMEEEKSVKDEPDEEKQPPPGCGIHWGTDLPPERVKSVKWLPEWVLTDLSRDEMRLLIKGLWRADGNWKQQDKTIYTSGIRFRDQLVRALLHCGYSTHTMLMYPAGTVRGYNFHDQTQDNKKHSLKFFKKLSAKKKLLYEPITARFDSWRVQWTDVSTKQGMGSSWPSMSAQRCITRVPYSLPRDGRIWCVDIAHDDHLIIAQRAHRTSDGRVTKQSRPIVVGNCHGSNTSGIRYAYRRERASETRERRASLAGDGKVLSAEEEEEVSLDGGKEQRQIVKVITSSTPLHNNNPNTATATAAATADTHAAEQPQLSILSNLLIGIVAGCFCQLFINPLSVIQTRIMTAAKHAATSSASPAVATAVKAHQSILSTALSIWREEGFFAFYTGLLPAFILTTNPAIQFLVFDRLKSMLTVILRQHEHTRPINAIESFVIGAIAKITATLATYPYIMAKLRLQYRGPLPEGQQAYKGTVDVITSILRRDGVVGLYAGLRAQLLKSVLGAALMFMMKEKIVEWSQKLLRTREEKEAAAAAAEGKGGARDKKEV